jgi:hypothetical protein
MTNQPAVQRSTTHVNSEFDAQTSGQIGGRAAGELFLLHSIQKTKEGIRLALTSKLEEAKGEARTLLTSDNSDGRQAAEYWLAFYAELERHIAIAKAGQ